MFALGLLAATDGLGAQPSEASWQRFSFEENHMGAPWKVTLYAPDSVAAKQAAEAAYARIEELNGILSDYDPNSELSRLSDTAPSPQPVRVSDDLWRVLEFSQRLSEKSDGAFDITVGPVVRFGVGRVEPKRCRAPTCWLPRARPPAFADSN